MLKSVQSLKSHLALKTTNNNGVTAFVPSNIDAKGILLYINPYMKSIDICIFFLCISFALYEVQHQS